MSQRQGAGAAQEQPGDAGPRAELRPLPAMSVCFAVVMGIVLAIEPELESTASKHGLVLVGYLATIFAVRLLPVSRNPRVLLFAEDFAFGAWMTTLYVSSCSISLHLGGGDTYDPWLAGIDRSLFGMPAAEALSGFLPGIFWQEAFHLAYFTYYPLVVLAMLFGTVGRQDPGAVRPSTLVAAVFFCCCLSYLFLPVVGPLGAHATLFPDGGPFTWLMDQIYGTVPDHHGGAFPSSHVAVGLASVYSLARRSRWLGLSSAVVFGGLCLSTVYCSYHYVMDVPAGLLVGTAGILAVEGARRLPERLLSGEWRSRLRLQGVAERVRVRH